MRRSPTSRGLARIPRQPVSHRHHRQDPLARAVGYACEALERRTLFTDTVFLDFGFNFPGGSITFDDDAIDDVNGPEVFGDSHTLISLTQTIQNQNIDLNGDFVANQADAQILADDVLSLVQREYAPFGVVVQAAAAANLGDVEDTLDLNGDGADNRDAYIFVCGDDPPANTAFGWAPVDDDNDDDNTGFCFADEMIRSLGITPAVTALARTSAHEAGHTFGLEHTDGSEIRGTGDMMAAPEADPAPDLRDFSAVHIFSRYPLGIQDEAGTQNNYDLLVDNVGAKAGFPAYVTGTGAFDRITLSNFDDDEIAVLVEPFGNSGFVGALTTFAYNIPKANGVLVEMGVSNDQLVVNANIGVNVEVRGMKGTDRVLVLGNGAASATYTPDAATTVSPDDATSFGGTLNVGALNLDFNEFETTGNVTVQDVTNLTMITPNGADGIDVGFVGTSQEIDGGSGGVSLVPLQFSGVANVTLDTATNDGAGLGEADDTVDIFASAVAAGLSTFTINTGIGHDILDINFAIGSMIPAGGLTFNAGIEPGVADLLNLRNGSFTNEVYTPTAPDGGTIDLDGSVITYLNLAPINDTVAVANVTLNGTAGPDVINVIDFGVINFADTTQFNSGNGTFELVNFANKDNVHIQGQGGGDTFNLNNPNPADGLDSLLLYGEDQANAGDDNAVDTFNLTGTPGDGIDTHALGGGGGDVFTFNGAGAGANGSVFIDGQGGDDDISVTAAASTPVDVTGSAGNDFLNVDGQGIDYQLTNTSFLSALAPITYNTVERLNLTNGSYDIALAVNVATAIHVNSGATLTGVGNASGGVTANAGGTVSPGNGGPGILSTGNLVFNAGSTLALDINGTTPGTQHDQLNVTGTVAINGGAITATIGGGYVSIPGDEIAIIRNNLADAVTGVGFDGGIILDFGGGQKFTIDYAYDADLDNAFNDVALIRYGAALAADPCDPDEEALFVSATALGDDIQVIPARGNSRGQVLINGVDEGTFRFKGHIYVMGQNGDDTIAVTMPSREVVLYGQTGNDTLGAGNADSILIGGFGNDLLRSGNGKDLLIGGAGADVLEAGNGGDILIAGATTYDGTSGAVATNNRIALCDIHDIWKHGGKPGDLNPGLLGPASLINDNDFDQLTGGGGKDWFLLNTGGGGTVDTITDRERGETVTDVA